jgi:hypothetical protein
MWGHRVLWQFLLSVLLRGIPRTARDAAFLFGATPMMAMATATAGTVSASTTPTSPTMQRSADNLEAGRERGLSPAATKRSRWFS